MEKLIKFYAVLLFFTGLAFAALSWETYQSDILIHHPRMSSGIVLGVLPVLFFFWVAGFFVLHRRHKSQLATEGSRSKQMEEVHRLKKALDSEAVERAKELANSAQTLQAILEACPAAVIVMDQQAKVEIWSRAAERIFGWSAEEVIGRELPIIPTDQREEPERGAQREFAEGNSPPVELKRLKKDGSLVDVSLSTAPLRDERGEVNGTIGIFLDVTEHKRDEHQRQVHAEELQGTNAELNRREKIMRSLLEDLQGSKIRLEEQSRALQKAYADLQSTQAELVQAEKIGALGRFSSGIAHEVKNPLGIILGGVEFLEKRLGKDPDTHTALKMMKDSTLRADSILRGLMQFSRPAELKKEKVSPEDLVEKTIAMVKYLAPVRNVRIQTDYAEKGLMVEVDKNQMQQVLFNILDNAIDAMHEGGDVNIKIFSEKDPDSGDPRCIILIADTGEGISIENQRKLFEPFFTTKRGSRGTGLGLSMARMIVENHEGRLILESEEGKGTTVRITLPLLKGGIARC